MEEECIICLEIINRNTNNFRINICQTCAYIVHLECYERYVMHFGKELCVVCNREIQNNTPIIIQNNNSIFNRQKAI